MTEAIINFFRNIIGNDFITVLIIAFIPIIELRGAIPVAIEMGMEWWQAFGLSFIGSCLAIPMLLLLLRPVLNLLKKIKFFNRFATTIEDMFTGKAAKIAAKTGGLGDVKKKELWIKLIGVFTFVALPIPLTGVWTGTAVAVFLGLPFFKSLITVMLGNFVAGSIVTLLSVFLQPYLDTVLTVFFIMVIVVVVFYIIMISVRMYKSKQRDKKRSDMIVTDIVMGGANRGDSNLTHVEIIDPLAKPGVSQNDATVDTDNHAESNDDAVTSSDVNDRNVDEDETSAIS